MSYSVPAVGCLGKTITARRAQETILGGLSEVRTKPNSLIGGKAESHSLFDLEPNELSANPQPNLVLRSCQK